MTAPNPNAADALFVGDWESLAMVHLEVPRAELQPTIPFELDFFDDRAFVSLVFFTMRGMRLARAPGLVNLLFRPLREQHFLNVRTYVRHHDEPGIHFITEWISHPLCVRLGPLLYSLPYRWGRHRFSLDANIFRAHVTDVATKTSVQCEMKFTQPFTFCEPGSGDAFFFERYAAFNSHAGRRKSFHVSHAPWEQCPAEASILDDSLLQAHFPWFTHARLAGANYSPGVRHVYIGWPQAISRGCSSPASLLQPPGEPAASRTS